MLQSGAQKSAELVKAAFNRISYSLTEVELFHTDRGKEFDNQTIEEILQAFGITRLLSKKGCPYDKRWRNLRINLSKSNLFIHSDLRP